MKYLAQTENITEEKDKDLSYNRVILDTTDGQIYTIVGVKYKLIDLGLPSGTLWMDRNVGAERVLDCGLYFAWGETQGYKSNEVGIKKNFTNNDYKYTNGEYEAKYCKADGLTTLENEDDAAFQYTNGECSMPSVEQYAELLENTIIYAVTTDNERILGTYKNARITYDKTIDETKRISHYEFINKTNETSKICLPCNGEAVNGSFGGSAIGDSTVGVHTNYWTNKLYIPHEFYYDYYNAYAFDITAPFWGGEQWCYPSGVLTTRYVGKCIRGCKSITK